MSDLFPEFTPSYLLAFQFSSWYPTFAETSIKSTIVRPLSKEFREYLESDGVVVPDGSEDLFVYFRASPARVLPMIACV
jgi:hypothetical protein